MNRSEQTSRGKNKRKNKNNATESQLKSVSSSVNKKAESTVHSQAASGDVPENLSPTVGRNHKHPDKESEISDPPLDSLTSLPVQRDASTSSFSEKNISSELVKIIISKQDLTSAFTFKLNERVKCSGCKKSNIIITHDINEMGKLLVDVLKENEVLKSENKDLKLRNETLNQLAIISHAVNEKTCVNSGIQPSTVNSNTSDTLMEAEDAGTTENASMEIDSKGHDGEWLLSKDKKKRSTYLSASGRNDNSSRNRIDSRTSSQEVEESFVKPENPENTNTWYEESNDIGADALNNNGVRQEWGEASCNMNWDIPSGDAKENETRSESGEEGIAQGNSNRYRSQGYHHGGDPELKYNDVYSREFRQSGRGPANRRDRERPARSGDRSRFKDGKRWGSKGERVYKVVEETFGDLFMAPKDCALAHCVAEDMRMGSGIAVTFRQMFKNVDELLQQGRRSGQVATLKNENRFIYYLVTKKVSNGKPHIRDLTSSLQEMKQHCIEFAVKKIAMPRIGCGLDRLEWSEVKNVLEDTFLDTDVKITVYNYQQDSAEQDLQIQRSKLFVCQKLMRLVSIAHGTGLMFLGTEDSHVDDTMKDLDTKYKFINDYKHHPKRVGDVVRIVKQECLYGLIVKKTVNDPFSYAIFNKCLSKFRDLLWKDEYQYFGIEAFIANGEDLTMEKVITLLKNVFYNKKLECWICWPQHLEGTYHQFNRPNYSGAGASYQKY